jgi:hypothetical protein
VDAKYLEELESLRDDSVKQKQK